MPEYFHLRVLDSFGDLGNNVPNYKLVHSIFILNNLIYKIKKHFNIYDFFGPCSNFHENWPCQSKFHSQNWTQGKGEFFDQDQIFMKIGPAGPNFTAKIGPGVGPFFHDPGPIFAVKFGPAGPNFIWKLDGGSKFHGGQIWYDTVTNWSDTVCQL